MLSTWHQLLVLLSLDRCATAGADVAGPLCCAVLCCAADADAARRR